MKKIKLLMFATLISFLTGCGGDGGSSSGGYEYPPIDVSSAKEELTGDEDYLSALKICNDSASAFDIIDIRSNPTTSEDGPNRISKPIPPGECAELHTNNCDINYKIDITYSDGNFWRHEAYFRECYYRNIITLYY